jgi:predicted MFS family arabinose efflux permease
MLARQLKNGHFIVEGLNSFSTTFYFYYFYFFTHQQFGVGNKTNLLLAALNGLIYAVMSWVGGHFAQRFGAFAALKLGFTTMIASLLAGTLVSSLPGHVLVMVGVTIGTCFTWPSLEALVSEGETRAGLQRMVGLYNVVWAATGALAYFVGGGVLEQLGPKSFLLVPAAILVVQLALTVWLERAAKAGPHPSATDRADVGCDAPAIPHPPAETKLFLRMAWFANPFAYIAINTLVAVMPLVAARLGLSTTLAGVCGSVWCFARMGAFYVFWQWPGWHYRFRWLLTAFLLLIASFAVILLVPNLAVLVLAQLVFGLAIGLIYYSSLFYSMDAGDTKGEHGGIHEAAIGLGNFAGPAFGAASLHFLPQHANSGALAVSALLVCGLIGLAGIRRRTRT